MGLHGCSFGVLQGHTFLLLVQSITMETMGGGLWRRRGSRGFAGDVPAAWYGYRSGRSTSPGRDWISTAYPARPRRGRRAGWAVVTGRSPVTNFIGNGELSNGGVCY